VLFYAGYLTYVENKEVPAIGAQNQDRSLAPSSMAIPGGQELSAYRSRVDWEHETSELACS
jgi:hypothetical protein